MIRIDGSRGEGGGQMLRSSLTLSLLTGQPFQMVHIRANRPKPGLAAQHLACVRAAAAIGQARVAGDGLGSQEVLFMPGSVRGGVYNFRIDTAGSVALVLQTIFLPLALRGGEASKVTITGGTHVKAAPSFHYLSEVWQPLQEQLGLPLRLCLSRAGFYPRGGGEMVAEIAPANEVVAFNQESPGATPGERPTVAGVIGVAGLQESICRRMANRAREALRKQGIEPKLLEESWPGGPGAAICLTLLISSAPIAAGFSALGERGKPAERVATEAVTALLNHWRTAPNALDPHAADQVLLPLAFSPGASRFQTSEVTQHLLTHAEIIGRFVSRPIAIEGNLGGPGWVILAGGGR